MKRRPSTHLEHVFDVPLLSVVGALPALVAGALREEHPAKKGHLIR